tara:strand:- start:104 stop:421 length:318 start_codon:yes stop_codon:yes gene_type:complete
MVWNSVPDEDVHSVANRVALRLSQSPTKALIITRQLIDCAISDSSADQFFAAHVEKEACAQGYLGDTWEFKEGRDSFLEKRKAVFHRHPEEAQHGREQSLLSARL